jgi:hypothetical protein
MLQHPKYLRIAHLMLLTKIGLTLVEAGIDDLS